ncbi:hypothetical protein [Streptomyces sp. CA-106131]
MALVVAIFVSISLIVTKAAQELPTAMLMSGRRLLENQRVFFGVHEGV